MSPYTVVFTVFLLLSVATADTVNSASGFYFIVNKAANDMGNTGRAISRASNNNTATLQEVTTSDNNSGNSLFTWSYSGQIIKGPAGTPSKCFDVSGSKYVVGQPVLAYKCSTNNAANQNFIFNAINSWTQIKVQKNQDLCVASSNSIGASSSSLVLATCSSDANQYWSFKSTVETSPAAPKLYVLNTATSDTRVLYLNASTFVVDNLSNTRSSVNLTSSAVTDRQPWKFADQTISTYVSSSVTVCLDVVSNRIVDGASVFGYSCTGGDNQRWIYSLTSNPTTIRAYSNTNLCLTPSSDINNSSLVLRTCVSQAQRAVNDQQFSLLSSLPTPTQPATQEPTQPATQEPTQPATQEPTQPATQPATEEPTQPATQPATEEPTQPATQEPTQPATQEPTQPATQEPTQPATQEPTQPATQEPTQPATQEPTQPATNEPTQPGVTGYLLHKAAGLRAGSVLKQSQSVYTPVVGRPQILTSYGIPPQPFLFSGNSIKTTAEPQGYCFEHEAGGGVTLAPCDGSDKQKFIYNTQSNPTTIQTFIGGLYVAPAGTQESYLYTGAAPSKRAADDNRQFYIESQIPTQPATEQPTQPATEEPTQPATEEPTQPATEEPTQPATEEPTQPATEEPTQPATEEPTQPATEQPTCAPVTPAPKEDTAPAAVTVTVSVDSSNLATFTWTAPDNGGDDIVKYTVTLRNSTHWSDVITLNDASTTSTTYHFERAIGSAERTVSVVASNTVGDGAVADPTPFIVLCRPGRHNVNGQCTPCPAGQMETDGDCQICPAGTSTNNVKGSTACSRCPKGYFSRSAGAYECSACAPGSTSTHDRTGCRPCRAGTYSWAYGSSCLSCPGQTEVGANSCVYQEPEESIRPAN